MSHQVGDIVRIKIHKKSDGWLQLVDKNARFPPDEDECSFKKVQIVGCWQMNANDYIVLCDFDPHSYFSFLIDAWHQKGYDIEDKFLGMRAANVTGDHIWPVQTQGPAPQLVLGKPGGMSCKLCKNFVQYAGVNRDDHSFVCKKCRDTKGYLLKCKPLDP